MWWDSPNQARSKEPTASEKINKEVWLEAQKDSLISLFFKALAIPKALENLEEMQNKHAIVVSLLLYNILLKYKLTVEM